jgi:hypothetical protein
MTTRPAFTRNLAGSASLGRKIVLGGAILAAVVAISAGPALAVVPPPMFNSIPAVLPGNVSSIGFEATSTSEFGDLIQLEGTAGNPGVTRLSQDLPVTVVMSSWACQSGGAIDTNPPADGFCVTTPGATFSVPITLNIYNVDMSGSVPAAGSTVLTTTQTFEIPYRPSYDATNCPADAPDPADPGRATYFRWYSASEDTCYSGFAYPIKFTLPSGVTLPDELIWSVSYNTADHGYSPTHVNGPINSLNVGIKSFAGEPNHGLDVEPANVFVNSTWSGAYSATETGDGGTTGVFRDTNGGWVGYAPIVCFGLVCPAAAPVSSPSPTVAPPTIAPPTDAPATGTPLASGTASVSDSPVTSASPNQSFDGETATPVESIEGATGTPVQATPPPTSTGDSSGGGSTSLMALTICLLFAMLGLAAVAGQRRSIRR